MIEDPVHGSGALPALRWPLPMFGTPVAVDVCALLALWPVWWWFGIEQLIPPLFAVWQMGRCVVRRGASVALAAPEMLALALAAWSLIPGLWVDPDELGVFAKETVTLWAQAFFLIVLRNEIRDAADWNRVLTGLWAAGVALATGGLIYASGVWRGEITSLLGLVLRDEWIARSEFLTSISHRAMGAESFGGLMDARVWSFALHPSSASMVCLVLIPIVFWAGWRRSGWTRAVSLIAGPALIVTLMMTESRAAWVAFGLGSLVTAFLVAYRTTDTKLRLLLAAGGTCGAVILGTLAGPTTVDAARRLATQVRPESWVTRVELYRDTIEMLDEHPIAGWGHPVERPDRRRLYSAGTHSSLLGMLFQHGVVGLGLYLALWASVWWVVLRQLWGSSRRPSAGGGFWIVATAGLFAFNVRETVDNWWWDQLVTTVVWCLWGLILTAHRRGVTQTVRDANPPGFASEVTQSPSSARGDR